MSVFFQVAYLFGFKPWDTGVPPPELVALVEGNDKRPPGKAVDLGCGTGTNCVYLAQHGWDVTGVDFVARAISAARRKAASAGVSPHLVVGDVTRLTEIGLGDGYELLLDLGCFSSIPDAGRNAYVEGATAIAQDDAVLLLFCLIRQAKPPRLGPRGIARGEVAERFAPGWEMVAEQQGQPVREYDTAWYRLHRR